MPMMVMKRPTRSSIASERGLMLSEPSGMAEVELERQRGHQQEGEGGEQREPVGRAHLLDLEDPLEGSQDESACDHTRDERIEDDQHAPLELDLVRVHEAFD